MVNLIMVVLLSHKPHNHLDYSDSVVVDMVLLRHLFLQLIRLNFVFLALRLKKLLLLKKILLCSVSLDSHREIRQR